uniref:uncharacterized protein LOC122583650 n=1 Tax=Erigeron canadensis TaxID=72917 RepID=UPI001CB8B042|nr:uncharacterized protein LOC122583650 [Erigeron canadensis]
MSSIKEFQHLKISLGVLKSATNNFAQTNCIGGGGFGKVYKGEILLSGVITMVAVKRLDRSLGQGTTEFWKEIMILFQYKHENLISLLGFCDELSENLLVYEYLSNKSLDLYISHTNFSWHKRLFICHRAARGLQFLHEPLKGSQQRVLHRDIKSANILLGDNLEPKISDFGLSKLGPANQQFTFVFSNAVGTRGYCDPLYDHTNLLSKESDVYSFGVVLFEVLCGRLAYAKYYNDMGTSLVALARKCYEENTLDTIIHSSIRETISPKSLERFSAIAYQCLHINREERPSMAKIVEELDLAYRYQGLANISLPEMPMKEIKVAAGNFKKCIWEDGRYQIYKGKLSISGGKPTMAFIKRFCDHHSKRYCLYQATFSCQVSPNINSVLGYCDDERGNIIVHEYAERGSLDQYISCRSNNTTLKWLQRLQICCGVAHGLYQLHNRGIAQGALSSANILLDKEWVAKVSDFMISAPSSTTILDVVTAKRLYSAPEYILSGKGSKEGDIYSLGMVLFEVVCGRLCTEEVDGYMLSAELIKDLHAKWKLDEIVDPRLRAQMIDDYSMGKYFAIAYRCLLDDPNERPTIQTLIKELEDIVRDEMQVATMQKFELKEIEVATNNFTSCIGSNRDGTLIYDGELSIFGIPTRVYLVRFLENSGSLSYYTELVDFLCKLHHPNFLSALGYCYEEGKKFIVREYPEGVSLDQYIRRNNRAYTTSLTWLQRLEICAAAGRGLSYFVSNKYTGLKGLESTSIVLDDKWVAKISDSGISTQYSTGLDRGADPYNSPEYITDGIETEKSNVYSFGMVLFEVLCGRLCTEEVDGVMLSAELMKESYEEKKLDEIVDPALLREKNINSDSLDKYSAMAYRCLLDDPKERPSMYIVVKELESIENNLRTNENAMTRVTQVHLLFVFMMALASLYLGYVSHQEDNNWIPDFLKFDVDKEAIPMEQCRNESTEVVGSPAGNGEVNPERQTDAVNSNGANFNLSLNFDGNFNLTDVNDALIEDTLEKIDGIYGNDTEFNGENNIIETKSRAENV